MAIEPTKVNTGADRPVTQINVLNAENRNVEREQLNRILSTLDSRISAVENNSSSGGGGSTGDITITADATQINVVQSSNNYDLSLATGGVTTSILADDAVTTAKLADANVTTSKLADTSVTYAKIQNVATDRLLGRDTAGSGVVEEISLNSTLSFTGSGSIQRAALTGDVTASAGSNATTIANNAVTDAKFRQSAGLSVIGRSANSTGNVADITAGTDGHVLRRSGTTLGFGTIPNTSVTGLGTMSTQDATSVNIDGGAIDGTAIGAATASTGRFTTLTTTSTATIGGNTSITGTLSTTGALQVGTSASALANTINGNTAIKTSNPVLRLDGATDWDLQSVDSGGRFRLLSGGVTEVFTVLSGGNVGIGTTSPSRKLSVVGDIGATTVVSTGDYYQVTDVHTIDANTGTESLTVNWSNGSVQKAQRGGNFTINTITGPSEYVANCTLYVYDTSTGAVITAPSNLIFICAGGALSSGLAGTYVYHGHWDGSNFYVSGYGRPTGDKRPS